MVGQVFIIFSSENQIQIFWGTNLPFKSDFESHFTLLKRGGGKHSWINPDFFRGKYNEPFPNEAEGSSKDPFQDFILVTL